MSVSKGGWLGAALATGLGAMAGAPAHAGDADGASDQCCMVIELRQYTLHPHKRDVLIDLFEREFIESQEAHGMRLVGQFRDLGNPDRFVWLRGFAGMPQRAQALQGFYDGPVWQAHRNTANATMIDAGNVLLLKPARADRGFAVDARALPPRDATAIPGGLVETRIHYLDAAPTPAQLELIESARPLLQAAGAMPLATLVTESAENTFPRLPVREGEHVVAWFSQFRDRDAHDRYLATLDASPAWRRIEGALLRDAPRGADVLLLEPTARSRLPR
jgi:quinol monooxygenase YgiN